MSDQKEPIEQLRHMFVSRQNGKDTDTCGLESEPCKTVAKTFSKATSSGLHLHIDGTGTVEDPYDCLEMPKAIMFDTKMILEGFNISPRIYCKFGINFVAPKGSSLVTLSNLIFISTPLGFLNLSIAINNCTIRDILDSWAITSGFRVRQKQTIRIERTIFRNNSMCLGLEAESQSDISQLFLTIRNTTFTRIQRDSVKAQLKTSKNFLLNIDCDGIVFTKNTGPFLDPTLQKTLGGKLTITAVIGNSIFSENAISVDNYLVFLCKDATSFCTLRAVNTTFTSNTGGGFFCRAVNLNFQNVTMNLTLGTAVAILPKANANIHIKDCMFAKNIASFAVLDDWQVLYTYSGINLRIQDSLFYGHYPAYASHSSQTNVVDLLQVKRNSTSQRNIVFDGITVEDTVGKAVHVSVLGSPNVVIKVTRSIFRRNGIRSTDQPSSNPTCQFTVIDASLNSHIEFEKTTFEENFAAHGVVVSHGLDTRLKNCYFLKNFVFSEGGDVVVWRSLTIQNSNF